MHIFVRYVPAKRMVNTTSTNLTFCLTSLVCLVTKWVTNTASTTWSLGLIFKCHSNVKVVSNDAHVGDQTAR